MFALKRTAAAVAVLAVTFCVAAAAAVPAAARGEEEPVKTLPTADLTIPAQSADAYGACYTWLRITPWLEMCNEGTRVYCDAASNITTGSRFVENERCPENS